MYLAIKSVKPLNNYKLLLKFENDEERVFDMTSYLDHGIFSELKNKKTPHSGRLDHMRDFPTNKIFCKKIK